MGQPTQAGDPRFPAISPVFALASTTRAWGIYILLAGVLAWFSFGDLRFHLLEMHDAETFLENKRISADFSYFFLPTKRWLPAACYTSSACGWPIWYGDRIQPPSTCSSSLCTLRPACS